MARHKLTKTEQVKGIKKALANRRTPRQFIPSLRKRLKALAGAAVWLLGLGLLLSPSLARAQSCPAGYTPLPWGVTRDGTTDERREIFCVDAQGHVAATSLGLVTTSGGIDASTFAGADLGAKIQAAVNYIGACGRDTINVSENGSVSSTITIPACAPPYTTVVKIRGKGRDTTTLTWTGAAGGLMFDSSAASDFSLWELGMEGGGVGGAATAVKTSTGATARYFDKFLFLYIHGFTGKVFDTGHPTGTSDSLWFDVKIDGGERGIDFSLPNNLVVYTDILNMTVSAVQLWGNSKPDFLGGHMSTNGHDIEVSGNSTGAEFDKVWFENSTTGILFSTDGASPPIAAAHTLLFPLVFRDCNLHTLTGASLLDTANITGAVNFTSNTIRSGGSSQTIVLASTLTDVIRQGNVGAIWSGDTAFQTVPGGFIHSVTGTQNSFFTLNDATGGATPQKRFRVASGCLQMLNDAQTFVRFEVCDGGSAKFGNLLNLPVIAAGGNPAAGGDIFINSATSLLDCKLSTGASCAPVGGGGTPGGADTQVQFNDAAAFGGDAGFTYVKSTDDLTVAGIVTAGSFSTSGAGAGFLSITKGSTPAAAADTFRVYQDTTENQPKYNINNSANWYALPASPLDSTIFQFDEEFMSGSNTSGQLGGAGWEATNIGAACASFNNVTGAWPNIGTVRATTTAVGSQGCSYGLGGSNGAAPVGNLTGNTKWEAVWVFALNKTSATTATTRFRIGFAPGATASIEPTTGIWLRYDTNAAYSDTAFHYICRTGSANTEPGGAPTVAVDNAFHTLRIKSTTAGMMVFQVDANSSVMILSGCPTADMNPTSIIVTDTTAARDVWLDKFAFRAWGLAR